MEHNEIRRSTSQNEKAVREAAKLTAHYSYRKNIRQPTTIRTKVLRRLQEASPEARKKTIDL